MQKTARVPAPGALELLIRGAWAERRLRRRRRPVAPYLPKVSGGHDASDTVACIIISKDRPMQLVACLRSLERFWPYGGPKYVLYKASDHAYESGYAVAQAETDARYVRETGTFRAHVMELLGNGCRFTAFLMDDDLMFRRPVAVVPSADFAAVSLRLGLNTTRSYAYGEDQRLPEMIRRPPLLAWDWSAASLDFAYPLSLDGSVVSTELLRRVLRSCRFGNPNQMEEQMHVRRHRVPRWLLASERSSLVNIPANIVTTTHNNRASADENLAPRALNDQFLAGARVDLDAMDFSAVTGPHQDIPIVLTLGSR